MTKHIFHIPMPPTINHAYGRRGKITYLTDEMKEFKEEVATIIMNLELYKNRLHGAVKITLELFFNHYTKGSKKEPSREKEGSIDVDNRDKVCYDALKKHDDTVRYIIEDDNQVFYGTHIKYYITSQPEFAIVTIEEIDRPAIPDYAFPLPQYLLDSIYRIQTKKKERATKKKDRKLKLLNNKG